MNLLDFLKSIWRASLHPSVGVMANWASILSLFTVLFNTWRLSKISRFTENERDKIEDLVQPFDLYCEIQEAIQALQKHRPQELISDEQKNAILEGLAASKSCLDLYFRQIHGLKGQRDNIFLAAAHCYWDRKKTDKALEHFEKAVARATDDRELAECLYGLRACHAMKRNHHACAIIDKRLDELQEDAEQIAPSSYLKSGVNMVFIYVRGILRPKDGEPRSVLPGTWEARFGRLRDLPRGGHAHRRQPAPGTGKPSVDHDAEI